jgi:TRAP-type C4-dicarboxylate transport system permease small subunit
MRGFLKYFGIAVGIQLVACLLVALLVSMFSPKVDFLLTGLFYAYTPTTFVIWKLGNFTGESAIVEPILLGIPLGIVLYSLIFGFVLGRMHSRNR